MLCLMKAMLLCEQSKKQASQLEPGGRRWIAFHEVCEVVLTVEKGKEEAKYNVVPLCSFVTQMFIESLPSAT